MNYDDINFGALFTLIVGFICGYHSGRSYYMRELRRQIRRGGKQ